MTETNRDRIWTSRNCTVQALVSSRQTEGRFAVCRITAIGPCSIPEHAHRYESLCFYVEEGEFRFDLGGRSVAALPGTVMFVPSLTVWKLSHESTAAGRLLLIASPGGLDLLFHDLAAAQAGALGPIFEKHGISTVSRLTVRSV